MTQGHKQIMTKCPTQQSSAFSHEPNPLSLPVLSVRPRISQPRHNFLHQHSITKFNKFHGMHLHISAFCVSIFPPCAYDVPLDHPHPYGFHSVRVERPPPKTCKIFMAMLCLSISSVKVVEFAGTQIVKWPSTNF